MPESVILCIFVFQIISWNVDPTDDSLEFCRSNNSYTITETITGIKLIYMRNTGTFDILIPEGNQTTLTGGLCGNANGDPEDDASADSVRYFTPVWPGASCL